MLEKLYNILMNRFDKLCVFKYWLYNIECCYRKEKEVFLKVFEVKEWFLLI